MNSPHLRKPVSVEISHSDYEGQAEARDSKLDSESRLSTNKDKPTEVSPFVLLFFEDEEELCQLRPKLPAMTAFEDTPTLRCLFGDAPEIGNMHRNTFFFTVLRVLQVSIFQNKRSSNSRFSSTMANLKEFQIQDGHHIQPL